ncbi:MAG: hypothetical protein LC775_13395, partial [Acidobacteria bacterium]|nr:hypothetical protein [Acidobacteriota bacterium]
MIFRGFSQRVTIVVAALMLLTWPAFAVADSDPIVFQAAGPTRDSILSNVDAFRNQLGTLNPNVPGSFPGGRREINWDGVPDIFAAPNELPFNFFNVNSPRGAVFFTPGSGFQVSANAINPTGTPVEFGNLNPTYPDIFSTFSPQRLFTALDSTVTFVLFFEPGSLTPATVSGFGAVFTDVDFPNSRRRCSRPASTKIDYFGIDGSLLHSIDSSQMQRMDDARLNHISVFRFSNSVASSPGNGSLSFLGVFFPDERVALVRITSGNTPLGPNETRCTDIVAMDDFIYGEPQP